MNQYIEQALESLRLEKQALEHKQGTLQQELSALTEQIKMVALSSRQLSKIYGQEEETTGVYTSMIIAEAVQDVLSTCDKPMTTAQIAHVLIDGGYLSTSSRFNSMVHSILKRREGTFQRTADGKYWMLCSKGEGEGDIKAEITPFATLKEHEIAEIEDGEIGSLETDPTDTENDDAIEKLALVFTKNKTLTLSSYRKEGE